uniref:Uncharacterized protein n=1 Tax=Arundo donax TaxID=35708 RepID=A0A0A9D2R7_ARUDO
MELSIASTSFPELSFSGFLDRLIPRFSTGCQPLHCVVQNLVSRM